MTSDPRDHRRVAAMQTSQSERGWDFRPCDEPPIWFRALAEVSSPRVEKDLFFQRPEDDS